MRIKISLSPEAFESAFLSQVKKRHKGEVEWPLKDLDSLVGEYENGEFWLVKKSFIPSNIPQRRFYGKLYCQEDGGVYLEGDFSFKHWSVIRIVLIIAFFLIIVFSCWDKPATEFLFVLFWYALLVTFCMISSVSKEKAVLSFLRSFADQMESDGASK